MKTMNKILLIGHLGQNPEQRRTDGGVLFTQLRVATERVKVKEGDDQKQTVDWHNVYVWGPQGERCAQWLQKGAPVFIEGELRQLESRSESGEKQKRTIINASDVNILSRRNGNLDNRT